MLRFQDLIDVISKRRTPKPSKEFWEKFDSELNRRLDEVDASRSDYRHVFAEKIMGFVGAFIQPKFRYALISACAVVLIISATMFSFNRYQPNIYSVASLSNDDLVEELLFVENAASQENGIDFIIDF